MLSNVEKALYEYLILSPQNATYMTKKKSCIMSNLTKKHAEKSLSMYIRVYKHNIHSII